MAKLPDLSSLTPDAKAIVGKISAKRGPMRGGPYASLMHHPALAEKVRSVGVADRIAEHLVDPANARRLAANAGWREIFYAGGTVAKDKLN